MNRMLGLGFACPDRLVQDANNMEHTTDKRATPFLELILPQSHKVRGSLLWTAKVQLQLEINFFAYIGSLIKILISTERSNDPCERDRCFKAGLFNAALSERGWSLGRWGSTEPDGLTPKVLHRTPSLCASAP